MNTENNTAIFYITDNGLKTAERLKVLYPDAPVLKFKSEIVSEIWNESRNLIFIMAAGIVVRTIAPLIKDKKTDPSVVVLDEKGEYAISLLSGHLGGANELAKKIAEFLKAEAIITTASDVNNLTSIDLWAKENNLVIEDWELVPQIGTRLLNNGALRIFSEIQIELPDEFLKVSDPRFADVLITNKKDPFTDSPIHRFTHSSIYPSTQLYLRPKNLVIGIGCNSGTSDKEIAEAIKAVFDENNLSFLSIHSIATIDIKEDEEGLNAFAEKYNFKIKTFNVDELNAVEGLQKSDVVFKATGANAVSEPAALLASGTSELLVPKYKLGNVTIAVAELNHFTTSPLHPFTTSPLHPFTTSPLHPFGRIYIVGTGPGSIEHLTPYAQDAIRKSDVIVGYGTYLDLIQELLKDKEVISTGMTKEVERCKRAVELAMSGKTVSVISGGDPGIYAMAGLVFEVLRAEARKSRSAEVTSELPNLQTSKLAIEVIPGISALNACAARLGAPLMHDFAVISLSDRLTPWELIEKRLAAAAMSDFVIVLYNPKSMGRPGHINKARAILLRYRSTETPVGIVKSAMRENERIIITNLRDMLNYDIDMQTTVIVGNSQTFTWNNYMITPRGYENKK